MRLISKKEVVEVQGIEEAVEYIRTSLKQGFTDVAIRANYKMSLFEITVSK